MVNKYPAFEVNHPYRIFKEEYLSLEWLTGASSQFWLNLQDQYDHQKGKKMAARKKVNRRNKPKVVVPEIVVPEVAEEVVEVVQKNSILLFSKNDGEGLLSVSVPSGSHFGITTQDFDTPRLQVYNNDKEILNIDNIPNLIGYQVDIML